MSKKEIEVSSSKYRGADGECVFGENKLSEYGVHERVSAETRREEPPCGGLKHSSLNLSAVVFNHER